MEIDFAHLDSSAESSHLLRAEICVIGGGIAGLTLAQELVELGHDVLLLEAGGPKRHEGPPASEVIQSGYPHPGTMEPRVSALGGTSLVWGGQLLPLPVDAEWPVTAKDLAPYMGRAERLLGVDNLPYDGENFFKDLHQQAPAFLRELPDLKLQLSKFAPFSHRNLARTIGGKLRKRSNARIAIHARAIELVLSQARDRIEAIIVRSTSGRTFRVEAKQNVLAAGTIETVRLLLASQSVAAEGVGNSRDQVGRNFHDHLTVIAATLRGEARQQLLALRPWIHRGTLHAFKLSAGAELCQQLNVNPVLAHLAIEEPANSGIQTIRNMLRARQRRGTAEGMYATFPDLPRALRDGTMLAMSALVQHRRYVSPRATVQLRLNVVQRGASASRITLAPDGRPALDWKIDGCEIVTLRKFTSYLRQRLTMDGIDWNSSLLEHASSTAIAGMDDARHVMGGACMGLDSRSSVVDSQLRVHGLNNLSIASAAVFPDGTPQLPTLPMMALTLRLADRLHRHS